MSVKKSSCACSKIRGFGIRCTAQCTGQQSGAATFDGSVFSSRAPNINNMNDFPDLCGDDCGASAPGSTE